MVAAFVTAGVAFLVLVALFIFWHEPELAGLANARGTVRLAGSPNNSQRR